MSIQNGFFKSINGDRRYLAEFFTSYFASFIGNGVFPNPSTNLQVINNQNFSTIVRPGKGWINGHYLNNDDNIVINHQPPDGVLRRIDRIVFSVNLDSRSMDIYLKQGTPSSAAVAPALVRNSTLYELALADISFNPGMVSISQSNITDQRMNGQLCGIVHGVVEQLDTTTLFNQYQQFLVDKGVEFDQQLAVNQQTFDDWFAQLNDILDGDVAANLANMIITHANNATPQKHIEVVNAIPQNLANKGLLLVIDDVDNPNNPPEVPTSMVLNERIDVVSTNLERISKHVREYGAIGDFQTDDTNAFNEAINDCSLNGYKLVTNGFNYKVTKLIIKEGSEIDFSGSTIKRLPTNLSRYEIISIDGVNDFRLINPTIIGDLDEHITTPSSNPNNLDGFAGEWGMGIEVKNSKGKIINPTISKCWGDAIYVTGSSTELEILGSANLFQCRRQGISIIECQRFYAQSLFIDGILRTLPASGVDIECNNNQENANNVRIDYLQVSNSNAAFDVVCRGNSINVSVGEINAIDCNSYLNFSYSEIGDSSDSNSGGLFNNTENSISVGKVRINKAYKSVLTLNRILYNVFPKVEIGDIIIDRMIYDVSKLNDIASQWNAILLLADRNYIYKIYGRVNIDNLRINSLINNTSLQPFVGLNRLTIGDNESTQQDVKIKNYSISDGKKFGVPFSSLTRTINCSFNDAEELNVLTSSDFILKNGFNLLRHSAIDVREYFTDAIVRSFVSTVSLQFNTHIILDYQIYINDVIVTSNTNVFNMNGKEIIFKRNDNPKELRIYFKNIDTLNISSTRPSNAVAGDVKANNTTKKIEWFDGINWYNADGTNV